MVWLRGVARSLTNEVKFCDYGHDRRDREMFEELKFQVT